MRVILITGGSRGIGASTAIECARRGFGVVLTYQQNMEAALETVFRIRHEGGKARRIRGNAVSPGPIRTELGGGLTPEFEELLASQTALGRLGEPEEVGRVVATLLSDDANWVNGQSIEVAGGYVA